MCLTLCQAEAGPKYYPGAIRAVETSTQRKENRQESLEEERREVPLSSGSGRGGVSHPDERHDAKSLFPSQLTEGQSR